jgi:hypothetical protein
LPNHAGYGPCRGDLNGPPRRPSPRSPRAGFASLEDARLPRAGSVPFEGVRFPRAGSASLEDPLPLEQAPPRSRVCPALDRGPPRSRAPRTRAPAPVRGHLTPWHRRDSAIMRPGLAPRYHRTNSPGGSPSPSLWGGGLCNAAGASPVTPTACSGTANAPSPRKGADCTLDLLSCDLAGLGEGARPVGRHPRHC